jgi:hypothetical protein
LNSGVIRRTLRGEGDAPCKITMWKTYHASSNRLQLLIFLLNTDEVAQNGCRFLLHIYKQNKLDPVLSSRMLPIHVKCDKIRVKGFGLSECKAAMSVPHLGPERDCLDISARTG